MRIKKYLLLSIVLVVLLPNNNKIVSGQQIIREPVIEVLDLYIDGTGGVFVNISKDFDYIMRVIYHLHFVDNSIDFDNFAGEASPLTNGFLVFYNDISFLNGGGAIKTNDDLGHVGYDIRLTTDDKNPKGRTIMGRLSFDKINIDGLLINSERTFAIKVQDNITALTSVSEISVFVEGYKKTVDSYFNLQDFFYPNAINDIGLRFLIIGQNYNLHLNTTNDMDYWINTTAQEESIQIKFSQETNKETNVINLFLYQGDTFKEKKTWLIEPQGYNPLGNVINSLGIVVAIFAIGILLLGLFSQKKGRR